MSPNGAQQTLVCGLRRLREQTFRMSGEGGKLTLTHRGVSRPLLAMRNGLNLCLLAALALSSSCSMADQDKHRALPPRGDVGERPAWDQTRAAKLVGATVLIGITRLSAAGAGREQMFGVIRSADARKGFEVVLGGSRSGQIYWIPPDLRNFSAARPGEYRLRSTGEVISDPDYISNWTIQPPTH